MSAQENPTSTPPSLAIGVVGAGTMGAGIAQTALQAGHSVWLFDINDTLVERGRETVAGHLNRLVEKGHLEAPERDAALARLHGTSDLAAVAPAGLVIEAAPESLPVKQEIFRRLDTICPDAILATNTSSLSIGEIAKAVERPGRVVGMHFFNPAPLMPLVEVVSSLRTSRPARDLVTNVARAWGKTPVQVNDAPGFIVNRVARPVYLEAFRMLGAGIADVPTIDRAMEAAGLKMGPFRLLDLIGIDVNYDVSKSVYLAFHCHPRFEPHSLQGKMVEAGYLGRKAGRGFYSYDGTSGDWRDIVDPTLTFPEATPELEAQVQRRIICCLVNEAAYALGDRVASAADIDIAMQLGTNYPQGPLAWADALGLETVIGVLQDLQRQGEERYEPAPILITRAHLGKPLAR